MGCGGIGVVHQLAHQTGLVDAIDDKVKVLKVHLPYRESDHVLNISYNVLAGGKCLDHLELLRNDEGYLNALGASRIPDPTTAGDFCRRFESEQQLLTLMEAVNDVRLKVWKQQDASFFEQAILDADGTIAPTTGECKEGMNISHNGIWGFHPLIVSLANTKEPLYLLNRPGNRPSHERADEYLDKAIGRCREAGFKHVLVRGDTDFMQTWKLDEWDKSGDVTFIFGADARKEMIARAEKLNPADWRRLERPAKYQHKTDPPELRARPDNIKEQVVVERGYKNLVLQYEDVAEFTHRPDLCKQAYRMIALRKKISVEKGQEKLFDEYRYFFYITNDRTKPQECNTLSVNSTVRFDLLFSRPSHDEPEGRVMGRAGDAGYAPAWFMLKYAFPCVSQVSCNSISWAPISRSHEARLGNTPTTLVRFFNRFMMFSSRFVLASFLR
jgi:hypothetical protein